jgi:hypothetical protein
VLGDYFVDHVAGAKEHELDVHRRAVTNWEGECISISGLAGSERGLRADMAVERYFELV